MLPVHHRWFAAFAIYLGLLGLIIGLAYAGLIGEHLIPVPYYDVVGHFVLMGGAGFLLHLTLRRRTVTLGRWAVPVAALLFGAAASLEEGAQLLSRLRTFEWLDLLANWAGILFAVWVADFLADELARYPSFGAFLRGSLSDLMRFVGKLALALLFPVSIFAALAVTRSLAFPLLGLYRYDFLLLLFLGVQVLLVVSGLESVAELKTITWFHLLGLALELFKVRAGSWAYPEPAWTKIGGVPLYSGFMYASVASFLIAVWHRLHLRLEGWPSVYAVAGLGAAIYLNFFTHHFVQDVRWLLILGVFFLFFRSRAVVVNTTKPRQVPLVASFLGLGFFIWVAENIATFFGAWAYPNQTQGWQMVHLSKINSWFLLSIISFMLVAELKRPRR